MIQKGDLAIMKDRNRKMPIGDFTSSHQEKDSFKQMQKLPTSQNRLCFVITGKKQNSWVEDLDTQEKLNRIARVFH